MNHSKGVLACCKSSILSGVPLPLGKQGYLLLLLLIVTLKEYLRTDFGEHIWQEKVCVRFK